MEQRDPFFRPPYWADLCAGLSAQAGDAHNACAEDKVNAAYYGTCIRGQFFGSLYHLLLASFSRGSTRATLSEVYADMRVALDFCDDVFKKHDHHFFTDGYPKNLVEQLTVLGFSYVFLAHDDRWSALASSFRKPHALVDRYVSLILSERPCAGEDVFAHAVLFRALYDVFDAPAPVRQRLLGNYLKHWEKKVAPQIFCGEKSRNIVIDDPEHAEYSAQYLASPFVGAWAFEVVPLVLHFDIDDSAFAQYGCYPQALVAFGREG